MWENPEIKFLEELKSLDQKLELDGFVRHFTFTKRRYIKGLLKVLKYANVPHRIEEVSTPRVVGNPIHSLYLYVKKEDSGLVSRLNHYTIERHNKRLYRFF